MTITMANGAPGKPPENQPSILLNRDENRLLSQVIGPKCLSLASAVVQVLFADHSGRWIKKYCGVACFIKDNPKKSFFIRVFDIVEQTVLWEHELYHEIDYQSPLPFFHTFETDDRQAGLNFANQDEAEHFYRMVQEKIDLLHRRREDNLRKREMQQQQNENLLKSQQVNRPSNGHMPVSTAQAVQVPFPVGLGSVKQTEERKKSKSTKVRSITKNDIGLPTNFVHVSHIGWDANRGFEYDDSDPVLQELFTKAGINMKTADPDTKQFIYGYIERELGGVDRVRDAVVRPARTQAMAPPPPTRTQNQPKVPVAAAPQSRPPPPPRLPSGTTLTRPNPPLPHIPANHKVQAPPPPPPLHMKGQAPLPAVPNQNTSRTSLTAPPPPPPPPPPGLNGSLSSLGSGSLGSGSLGSGETSPSSNEVDGQGRSALMDEIRRGRELKKVEQQQQAAAPSGRDKLLSDIQHGVQLKHVDPEKLSLGKEETPQLDGMAAALAKALALRRSAVQYKEDSGSEGDDDDDEWDC